MKSIDIVTVATNNYVDYWADMVKTAEKFLDVSCHVTMNVFTDNPAWCESIRSCTEKLSIQIFEIESLKWPMATLLRYNLIDKFAPALKSEYIMHLDADMLIKRDFTVPLIHYEDKYDVSLVSHPGYFRPKSFKKIVFYSRNRRFIFRDAIAKIRLGGIGSWEISRESRAYVPRFKRKVYVCGGTWLGKSKAIKEMVAQLSREVDLDLKKGVIATWHDESHLNKWASINKFNLLTPSYCADPTYPQLEGLPIFIEAVDNGTK